MKKIVVCVLILALIGCSTVEKQEEEKHSYVNITSGEELIGAYRDGEDITEEQKKLREQMKENIGQFLNRDKDELEFKRFCMLEEEGMTVEVKVDGVEYTFTCDMTGKIVEYAEIVEIKKLKQVWNMRKRIEIERNMRYNN